MEDLTQGSPISITLPTDKYKDTSENFAVNNNILYLAGINQNQKNEITLRTYNVGNDTATSTITITLDGPSVIEVVEITDMLIYKDYIYMTIYDHSQDPLRVNSRGMLIRIPLKTLEPTSVESLGWTTANISVNGTITCYTPGSKEVDTAFFGPKNIIGIKDNVIEIADEGHFITYNSSSYVYENVDRVVSVNLDTFTISKVDVLTNSNIHLSEHNTKEYYNDKIGGNITPKL